MRNAIPYDPVLIGKINMTDIKGIRDTSFVENELYGVFPYKLVGKVYFTQDGVNYVCSGSVVGVSFDVSRKY